jgi:hypothetical protein
MGKCSPENMIFVPAVNCLDRDNRRAQTQITGTDIGIEPDFDLA